MAMGGGGGETTGARSHQYNRVLSVSAVNHNVSPCVLFTVFCFYFGSLFL